MRITTKIVIGFILVTSGTAWLGIQKLHVLESQLIEIKTQLTALKTPIHNVVIADALRMCLSHGGIQNLVRLSAFKYNIECKDGAWFLNLKLMPNDKAVSPTVLLKDIVS